MEAINNLLGGSGAGRFILRLRGADAAVRRARHRESVQPQSGHERDVSRADDHLDGGLFVLLHAFFLAAVQILVYAGAVMVLFLFVIMLLDLKEEQRRRIKLFGLVAGLISVGTSSSSF
jgi:hypothetical protein